MIHDKWVELRQLVYFEAVARCGGFTRAAEDLRIAQPAVSAQVKQLERELGASLIERTTRTMVLTHAGELVLVRARAVLAELDGIRSDLGDLESVLRGRLRLGATAVTGSLDLPGTLATFRRRCPGVALGVRSGLVAALVRHLARGELDAVIGPVYDDLDPHLEVRHRVEERLVLITTPGRRRGGPLTLADVRDETFVCLSPASGLRKLVVQACAEAGFVPHVGVEAADPVGIRSFVAAGLGVALLAESASTAPGPPIDVHALDPSPWYPPIGLITDPRRAPSPTLSAWIRHLEDAAPLRIEVRPRHR